VVSRQGGVHLRGHVTYAMLHLQHTWCGALDGRPPMTGVIPDERHHLSYHTKPITCPTITWHSIRCRSLHVQASYSTYHVWYGAAASHMVQQQAIWCSSKPYGAAASHMEWHTCKVVRSRRSRSPPAAVYLCFLLSWCHGVMLLRYVSCCCGMCHLVAVCCVACCCGVRIK